MSTYTNSHKKYYKENRKRIREQQKKYSKKNKIKCRENTRRWITKMDIE